MSSFFPLFPPRSQLFHRSYSNKHTSRTGADFSVWRSGSFVPCCSAAACCRCRGGVNAAVIAASPLRSVLPTAILARPEEESVCSACSSRRSILLATLRSSVVDHESFAAMSRRLGRAFVSVSHVHVCGVLHDIDGTELPEMASRNTQILCSILELFPLCHDVRDTLIFQSRAV